MRKMLGVLLVVALLAAGGVAYALLSSSSATAQDENATTAQDESGTTDTTVVDDPESDDTTTDDGVARQGRRDILGEVLEGLVADDVITQEELDQLMADLQAEGFRFRHGFGTDSDQDATESSFSF